MRKYILAALTAFGLLFVGSVPSSASEEVTVSNEILNAPDNDCPTWATSNFARTLTLTPTGDDTWDVHSEIAGEWTETDDSGSHGTLTGYVEYTVTGELDEAKVASFDTTTVDFDAYACKSDVLQTAPHYSAGQFALNYFEDGAAAGPITDWQYVYDTACADEFVEEDGTEAVGATTFDPCPVIELVEPVLTQPTCDAPAFVDLAPATGVADYLVNGNAAGILPTRVSIGFPVESVLVEPVPLDEYVLPDGFDGWRFTIEWPDDCEEPTETPTPTPTEPEPTPTPTPTPSPDLCAAYVDSDSWCEQGVPDYNCADIPDGDKPVLLVDADHDPFALDAEGDGKGCEEDGDIPNTGGDGDDELPDTGPETLWMAVAGLGLLGAGTLVLLRLRTR